MEKNPMPVSPMKVLLALDDSAHSEYALESVLGRPWPDGSDFLVFTVFEPYHPDFAGWEPHAVVQAMRYAKTLEEQIKSYAEKSVERLTGSLSNSHKISYEVVENARVKETIIQKAIDWQADLIIMGSHGRTGLERFLLGSVSQAVVSHAPCSVEIIKRPAR